MLLVAAVTCLPRCEKLSCTCEVDSHDQRAGGSAEFQSALWLSKWSC